MSDNFWGIWTGRDTYLGATSIQLFAERCGRVSSKLPLRQLLQRY